MEDILEAILETILEKLVKSNRVSKIIRYLTVVVVCGFMVGLGVIMGLASNIEIPGRIFGFVLAILFLVLGMYWISRIRKS